MADGPLTAIANLRGRTDQNGYLIVSIVGAGSGGTSSVDKASFTVGVSAGTLAMGVVAPVDTVIAGTIAGLAMDTARNLKVNVVAGGAGGGAVTIADGADVAEGTTTDVAVTGDNAGTEMAKLRGANKITADVWDSVNHWLKVNLQNTTVAVTQSGGWTATVSQGTAANLNAAVVGTGTAGAAAGGILTVQGVASMTKLLVTPDSVALPANQSVNVAQVAGATTATGHGTAAGSLRVELPTDGTGVIATVSAVTAITNALPTGSNLIGKAGIDQTTPGTTNAVAVTTAVTLKRVAITASSSGDNTAISAVGGKKLTIVAFEISFSGTVNAKFTDGAGGTNLGGLYYGVANAGAANSVSLPAYLFQGSTNTALVINLSGATAIGGGITYYEA